MIPIHHSFKAQLDQPPPAALRIPHRLCSAFLSLTVSHGRDPLRSPQSFAAADIHASHRNNAATLSERHARDTSGPTGHWGGSHTPLERARLNLPLVSLLCKFVSLKHREVECVLQGHPARRWYKPIPQLTFCAPVWASQSPLGLTEQSSDGGGFWWAFILNL